MMLRSQACVPLWPQAFSLAALTPRIAQMPGEKRGFDPSHLILHVIRDFKDTVYPFFESDTLFLECLFCVLFLVV